MANPAHEAVLRQGAAEWNDWRSANPSLTPDLVGLRMSAVNLTGCDLSHAQLASACLIRAKLEGADLRYADLTGAELHEAELSDADLFHSKLAKAWLPGAKLRRARLFGAVLDGAQVTIVDFRKADFRRASLRQTDLRESLGTGASFEEADLTEAELAGCQLSGANLTGVQGLTGTQLAAASFDETTILPDRHGTSQTRTLEALNRALEAMKARVANETVPESDVQSYHTLLGQLESYGIHAAKERIRDEELVRPVTSWERSSGGEAFELAPVRWVDSELFQRKLDAVLDRIRQHQG